ncbi:amidase [Tomitella cavernea]|uniref:amidase n=2 Tax=Tomitella cavernea TaxID=1387982 RepID=A0ABP9C8T1_9ACTN
MSPGGTSPDDASPDSPSPDDAHDPAAAGDPGETAVQIAARVGSGVCPPDAAVARTLRRIDARDHELGAFRRVRAEEALREARGLADRADLARLPLAGVPVAVKDVLAVTGESVRFGSAATSAAPEAADHALVARLRAAGAVIVGLTAVPELCIFPTTDSSFGITRNPWDRSRTPGGSSGGSGAAVSAGMVPVAHGTDGLGSIRIPSADCGLFGIKPGRHLLPGDGGADSWYGMSESGPMATTVADAALMLSVLAGDPGLAHPEPAAGLRIGVSAGTPSPVTRLASSLADALEQVADTLLRAGHQVARARVPYPRNPLGLLARWTRGPAGQARTLDRRMLAPRTRTHTAIGDAVERWGLVKDSYAQRIEQDMRALFADFDIVATPTLLRTAPAAARWSDRRWLPNAVSSIRYASYPGIWNVLGWPAASVPAGVHPGDGMPIGVQLAGPPGSEATILALAAEIESLRPWPRTAPDYAGGVRH